LLEFTRISGGCALWTHRRSALRRAGALVGDTWRRSTRVSVPRDGRSARRGAARATS